ncbi:hypothetical protein ACFU76_39645, partial [Streptomyces sp. NPDC057539]|uniref:hypothetical protein n=1 Tax=Streptomyces sp. NPDC057539 TaxID=3346159 RepID=UPI0036954290
PVLFEDGSSLCVYQRALACGASLVDGPLEHVGSPPVPIGVGGISNRADHMLRRFNVSLIMSMQVDSLSGFLAGSCSVSCALDVRTCVVVDAFE